MVNRIKLYNTDDFPEDPPEPEPGPEDGPGPLLVVLACTTLACVYVVLIFVAYLACVGFRHTFLN